MRKELRGLRFAFLALQNGHMAETKRADLMPQEPAVLSAIITAGGASDADLV